MHKPVLKNLVLGAAGIFAAVSAEAQIGLSTLGYTQNFDLGSTSGTWTDNSTLPGWYAANNDAGTVTAYTAYSVGAGGGTSSSALYTLGISGSSERSLGGAPASARYTILGLRLANDTGALFEGLSVQYDVEQWSDRGTATVSLSYQKFAPGAGSLSVLTGWTLLRSDISPLPTSGTPTSGIGNTTGLLDDLKTGADSLALAAGDELWLRWEITKINGANSTHGIDNVIVVVPEPGSAMLGLMGLGLLMLRRRSN